MIRQSSLLDSLKYQYCGFLITDRLRCDIKAIEFRYKERSARTRPGLDPGDHLVVVGILLLVDINPAWRCLRRPVPASARHVDAVEVRVIVHTIHRLRSRQALNFLTR